MNKRTFGIAVLLSSLVLCKFAYANKTIADCQKKESTIEEHSMCLDRVKELVDRELQTWINNQTFELEDLALNSGRDAPLEMFKRSQRNFLTYRENNCRWQYLATSPSQEAASVYKTCYILVSKNRIKELSIQKPIEKNQIRGY